MTGKEAINHLMKKILESGDVTEDDIIAFSVIWHLVEKENKR